MSNPATNPFWQYSLAVYASPGVGDVCIALQDEQGLDVNLLLYAAWLASQRVPLTTEHLRDVESGIQSWRERMVLPLRTLRRTWREHSESQPYADELLALELRLEQVQQDTMYAVFCRLAPAVSDNTDLRANLAVVAKSGLCASGSAEQIAQLAGLIVDADTG